ncbi:hypothetical protein E3J38_08725 [candidate division TA06 bacterium]|uniref:MerR family transcriptional regulator n=1 Tax=candidate division TA06 bacterium TaxID=2250710 RepID=A0A523XGG6_UNCT6|nr:MAG: hypothetical protein E3J38_08725 [candidate division TA06 bacterium]
MTKESTSTIVGGKSTCICTSSQIMMAGEVLKLVKGLTRDKLSYFVRAGYVSPRKVKRGSLDQNQFSEKDAFLIGRAWEYMTRYQTSPKAAFEKAARDYPQMGFNFKSSSTSDSQRGKGGDG